MQIDSASFKRIISFLCLISFCFCSIVFSVSAADAPVGSDKGLLQYDLLSGSNYIISTTSDFEFAGTWEYPAVNLSGVTDISFSWLPYTSNSLGFDEVHFAISSIQKPSSVKFNSGNLSTDVSAIYIGELSTSNSDVFFYSVPFSGGIDQLKFTFEFSDPYDGYFGFYNCIGLLDVAASISKVDIYRVDEYFPVNDDHYYEEAEPLKNKSLPYVYSSFGDDVDYGVSTFQVIVRSANFESNLISKISLLASSCVDKIYYSASLVKKGSSGSDVNDIKHNLVLNEQWSMAADFSSIGDGFAQYGTIEYSTDLTGYNMADYDLMFSFTVYSISDGYVDFSVRSIRYVPFVDSSPWYKTFFGPLLTGIKDLCFGIYSSIRDFFDMVSGNFIHLFDKLEEYFGNDGTLADAGEAMSDQAEQMDQANQAMDEVERPSLDSDAMFSGMLDFDTGGLSILACMTSNGYVTQLLVVVFTFALCSYVFFGKRR